MAVPAQAARRTRAFSLVEVLIGISILSIVVGGCFAALLQAYRMQETSRMTTIATEILQNELESIRNMLWNEFVTLPASQALVISTRFGATRTRFTGTRTLSTIRANETLKVVIQVSWTTPGQRSHTRRIATYVSKNGRSHVGSTSPYNDWSDDEEVLW